MCPAKTTGCVPPQEGGGDEEADEDEDKPLSSHPDADTTIIFTTGEGRCGSWSVFYSLFLMHQTESVCGVCVTISEFPTNEIVKFLVGFTNKGSQDFTVQSLEASFRYPQDFQFYIQNVSLICSTILTSTSLQFSAIWRNSLVLTLCGIRQNKVVSDGVVPAEGDRKKPRINILLLSKMKITNVFGALCF